MRLEGKVALVTGAGGGFGRAIVTRFAEEGAIVIAADIRKTDFESKDAYPAELDVSRENSWLRIVEEVKYEWQRIDILVNNAGIITHDSVLDQDLERWEQMIAVNQTGVMLGMKSVLPVMLATNSGAVVNVSSTLGVVAVKGAIAYHATKAAVLAMTKNAAISHVREGIRVNAVLPGISDTQMVRAQPQEFTDSGVASHPMGRLSKPLEIANAILFLASDEASAITGVGLPVDGGYLAQ